MPPRAKKPVPTPEIDPFADAPPLDGDEAQTELPPPWDPGNETDVNSTDTNEKAKVSYMGAEAKVVTTIKGGRDYDEPWIVFHDDTLDDAIAHVTDKVKLGDLMKAAQEASKAFRSFREGQDTGSTTSTSQGGSQTRSQGRPAAATDGPLGKQVCQHGTKKFWSKFDEEKKEMVQIYFCPADKSNPQRCKNQYVN